MIEKKNQSPRSLAVSLLLSGALLQAQQTETSPPSPLLGEEIAKTVAHYSQNGALVGAVTLVAQDGAVLDLRAHGVKNLDSKIPVTPNTIFKIHSFTKAITCAAALMLYEEGKYQFTDPVSRWIPEFSSMKIAEAGGKLTDAKHAVTVHHLLTHTSGLTYEHRKVFDEPNLEAMVKSLAAQPLGFEPGEKWTYGMSIDVLGRLVEIWSGQPYEAFLEERILTPLGMEDTAFFVPVEKRSRKITLYQSSNRNSTDFRVDDEDGETPSEQPGFCMPGGGLYSTAFDYYAFLRMIINGGKYDGKRYLKMETVRMMTSNQVPESVGWIRFGDEIRDGFGYGYGFNVVAQKSQFDPDARVGECGWGGKASCHYWFDPDSKLAAITLEQLVPYRWSLERALKPVVYDLVK